MRRLLLILLATAPLTGCQFLSAGEDVAIIDPFEGAEEAIGEVSEDVAQALDGDAAEEAALAEAAAGVTPTVTADLISSTNPTARTRQVSQSRVDPFAVLPIPLAPDPVVEIPTIRRGGSGSSGSTSGGGAAAVAARPQNAPTPPPVRVQEQNAPLVRPSPITPLPRIPQPVIAPTISVSGIIQLGGEPYAIVTSGSEPERYVRVGDHLAGGSVRVKRIDTMAFEPQVILEENGIEVSRPVGGGSGGSGGSGTSRPAGGSGPAEAPTVPVAALPVPRVPSSGSSALPAISLPAPPAVQRPAAGEVPGSLLLQPAELTSQVTFPNMQIAIPETV